MSLLLVDNYDSFTYNLAQYFGELGAEVTVERNDMIAVETIAARAPDAIAISPGPCTPNEAGISMDVVRRFGRRGLVSLAYAMLAGRMYPTLKYALGHGHACRRLNIGGETTPVLRDVIPLAAHAGG